MSRPTRRAVLPLLAGLSASALIIRPARAATRISPTLIEIGPGQFAALLELTNADDAPLAIQCDAVAWSQAGDRDIQEPTDDVIVSPPGATIPPGATQVIRAILRQRAPVDSERGYRLLINEIPPPTSGPRRGVVFEIVHSVPLFRVPPASQPGLLRWSADRVGTEWDLVAANAGGRYIRLRNLAATAGRGQPVGVKPAAQIPYVLPGNARRFRLTGLPAGATAVQLVGDSQLGHFEQTVPLTR